MTDTSNRKRSGPLLLFFALFTVIVIVLLGWLAMNATRPDEYVEPAKSDAIRFMEMQALIRSVEGEPTDAYPQTYKFDALDASRAVAKQGATILPWSERGPSNVGGRTRAIVVDANDPTNRTWFAGAVSGGIWRTTDQGQSWTPLTEDWPTLSVTAIVQAPSRPDVLYAGTGEGFFNVGAVVGDGLFQSTDGGDTWSPMWSTRGNPLFKYVNRMIVHPEFHSVLVVATNTGVYRTEDGGATWKAVLEPGGRMAQIGHEPGNFYTQYASETGRGIWKSTDGGSTWAFSGAGMTVPNGSRVEFGISPVLPGRIIAMVDVRSGLEEIYISDNRASHWVLVPSTAANPPDIGADQAWYDMVVTPHPYDANVVFVGGVQMYRLTLNGSQSTLAASTREIGTDFFLDFIDFGAEYLRGGLRLGIDDDEANITPEQMTSVEIRFGPGISQRAHRFTPPDGPGIAFVDYPYADFVDVPFQVWDTQNNRQLHVSFRDRLGDGVFDLTPDDASNLGREYILIHAFPYGAGTAHSSIAQNGGVRNGLMYFLWPILAPEALWQPDNLPSSTLHIDLVQATAPATWTSTIIGTGVHVDHHALVPVPFDPQAGTFGLISGNDGGVFWSGSGGQSWVDRSRGYNTTQFYGVDRRPGANIYIGGMQDNGTYRSFQPFGTDIPGWTPAAIGGDGFDAVWHQSDPNRLLGGSQFNGLRRSVDGGLTWSNATTGLLDTGGSNANAPFLNSIERSPFNSDTLFAIGGSGVWLSPNFGQSWQLRPALADRWAFQSNARGTVRPSLASPRVIWAGYEMDPFDNGGDDIVGQLHVSTNAGATFRPVPTPSISPGYLSGLATHPTQDSTAFALFSSSGRAKILRTTDLGETWTDLSGFSDGPSGTLSVRGFPDVAVHDLVVLPGATEVLWVGTEIGLFVSEDDGESWSFANNGLPAVSIWRMRVVGDEVVLATHGRGVWTVPLNAAIATAAEPTDALPTTTTLGSAYPNPFRAQLAIPYELDGAGRVRMDIYDLQGRRVATLVDGEQPVGRHVALWQADAAAAGTYVIRLSADGHTSTRTVVRLN
ncbi:MAG: T9SS type A sorting domain-containing protein [Rhodothermales bacterium]